MKLLDTSPVVGHTRAMGIYAEQIVPRITNVVMARKEFTPIPDLLT